MNIQTIKTLLIIFIIIIINFVLVSCAELSTNLNKLKNAYTSKKETKPIEYKNLYAILEHNEKEKTKLSANQNLISVKNQPIKIKLMVIDVEKKQFSSLNKQNCIDFFEWRKDINYIFYSNRVEVGVNDCIYKNEFYEGKERLSNDELYNRSISKQYSYKRESYLYHNVVYRIITKGLNKDYPIDISFYSSIPSFRAFDFNYQKQKQEIAEYLESFKNLKKNEIILIKGIFLGEIVTGSGLNIEISSYIKDIEFLSYKQ